MTQAEQRPDENSSAAQAEIERLKQELSRSHDMHTRALADFGNYRKRVQRDQIGLPHRQANASWCWPCSTLWTTLSAPWPTPIPHRNPSWRARVSSING